MLDFKALQQTASQLKPRGPARDQDAAALYAQALELLSAYHNQPSVAQLQAVMHKLIDAIVANRRLLEPYVLLAYVYYALQLPQLAAQYFRIARELAPDAPALLRLQEVLSQGQPVARHGAGPGSGPQAFTPSAMPLGADQEIDYDALYDEVEAEIMRQVRAMMDRPLQALAPGLAPDSLSALRDEAASLEQVHRGLSLQLEILDREIDIGELQRLIRPLEQRLGQYSKLLLASERFIALNQAISGQIATASELSGRLDQLESMSPAERSASEGRLEALLDACDGFADELDELDRQGFGIAPVEGTYQDLVSRIEAIQDLLE